MVTLAPPVEHDALADSFFRIAGLVASAGFWLLFNFWGGLGLLVAAGIALLGVVVWFVQEKWFYKKEEFKHLR